jgi:hypothetical protein
MALNQYHQVLEEAQEVLAQLVERQELKAVAKKAPAKEIIKRVEEKTEVENKQPKKRGRKPKAALKVNTVLTKKTK